MALPEYIRVQAFQKLAQMKLPVRIGPPFSNEESMAIIYAIEDGSLIGGQLPDGNIEVTSIPYATRALISKDSDLSKIKKTATKGLSLVNKLLVTIGVIVAIILAALQIQDILLSRSEAAKKTEQDAAANP